MENSTSILTQAQGRTVELQRRHTHSCWNLGLCTSRISWRQKVCDIHYTTRLDNIAQTGKVLFGFFFPWDLLTVSESLQKWCFPQLSVVQLISKKSNARFSCAAKHVLSNRRKNFTLSPFTASALSFHGRTKSILQRRKLDTHKRTRTQPYTNADSECAEL